MKVILKLYATLTDYLPPGSHHNQAEIEVEETDSVAAIIDRYRLPAKLTHLVLINGNYVEPANRATQRVSEGDQIAIWPPIAGG